MTYMQILGYILATFGVTFLWSLLLFAIINILKSIGNEL